MGQQAPIRRFSVHAANESRHNAHAVRAESFEDAAIGFVERWLPAPEDGDDEARVVVHDPDTGAEQCFVIDIGSGEAAPC